MIRRYLLFLALLAGSVTGGAWLMNASSPAPGAGQDLKFPHGKHVTELSMACADCHVLATATAPAAMRPGHDNCTSCHETQVTSECAYCHTDPENIPPAGGRTSDLIFPHEIHVPAGGGCDGCHAGIATAAAGVSVPGPTMETCYTCHNDVAQSNACELCHRNFAMLLPPDHRVADFAHKHRDETRLGALAVECRTCHTETFCQECHQGTGLKNFTTRDRMTDPRPRTSTQDAPDQTVLQSVHGLNYPSPTALTPAPGSPSVSAATRSRPSVPTATPPAGTSVRARSSPHRISWRGTPRSRPASGAASMPPRPAGTWSRA
jgi:predicted CXXCH cytochrome family protein